MLYSKVHAETTDDDDDDDSSIAGVVRRSNRSRGCCCCCCRRVLPTCWVENGIIRFILGLLFNINGNGRQTATPPPSLSPHTQMMLCVGSRQDRDVDGGLFTR